MCKPINMIHFDFILLHIAQKIVSLVWQLMDILHFKCCLNKAFFHTCANITLQHKLPHCHYLLDDLCVKCIHVRNLHKPTFPQIKRRKKLFKHVTCSIRLNNQLQKRGAHWHAAKAQTKKGIVRRTSKLEFSHCSYKGKYTYIPSTPSNHIKPKGNIWVEFSTKLHVISSSINWPLVKIKLFPNQNDSNVGKIREKIRTLSVFFLLSVTSEQGILLIYCVVHGKIPLQQGNRKIVFLQKIRKESKLLAFFFYSYVPVGRFF